MFGGGQGVNYDDGGPLRVPELKILLSMHNLSTVGSKANLFGRLRDYMKNRSGKHVKTEPGLLPLPCKDPQITQFYQPNGWAQPLKSEKIISKLPEREMIKTKMAETQTEMALTKVFVDPAGFAYMFESEILKKKMAQTQTKMPLTNMAETQTERDLVKKKMAETQTGEDMAWKKMAETQTDGDMVKKKTAKTQTKADIFQKKVVETQNEPEIGRTKMAETQTEMEMVKNETVEPETTLMKITEPKYKSQRIEIDQANEKVSTHLKKIGTYILIIVTKVRYDECYKLMGNPLF